MGGQPGKEQDATGPRNGVDDKNPSITLSEQSLDSRLRSETEASPIGGVHLSPSNLEQHNLCSEPRRSSFQQPPAQQPKCRHARHDVPAYEPLDQLEKRKHDRRSLDDRLNAMVPPPTNRRPSMVQRLSQFTSGMVSAITIIEAQKQTLLEEGMTAPNFAFGVINFGATTFVVGAHPEFYWLYFAVQSLLLLAARTVSWWQQKLQFYLLDFCWVFNYILCAISLGAAFDQVLRPQLPELLGLDPSYAQTASNHAQRGAGVPVIGLRDARACLGCPANVPCQIPRPSQLSLSISGKHHVLRRWRAGTRPLARACCPMTSPRSSRRSAGRCSSW